MSEKPVRLNEIKNKVFLPILLIINVKIKGITIFPTTNSVENKIAVLTLSY